MVEGEELMEGGRQGVFSGRGCSCQGVIREAERQLSDRQNSCVHLIAEFRHQFGPFNFVSCSN